MSRNAKILIDLAVLAAVYGIWLLPKWRRLGKRPLLVYTLMYGCLASIARFTLMPVLAALPFCFDHPYIPMHMAPFEDVILRHGDYVRQIVLNIALFVPFGVLLPLFRYTITKSGILRSKTEKKQKSEERNMDERIYREYVAILKEELQPAMGCTEPIAVAYCAALARRTLGALPETVEVLASANIIKNVKSVIVPNTNGQRGIAAAAAAGIVSGNADAQLQVLASLTPEQVDAVGAYLQQAAFTVRRADKDYVFDIQVRVTAGADSASVEIAGYHTNVIRIEKNGVVQFHKDYQESGSQHATDRSLLTVEHIIAFANEVDIADVQETLQRQIDYNWAIAEEGLRGDYGANIGRILLQSYGMSIHNRAKAYAAAGSDARMNGCDLPVVINSGSGNQGLTASLPVIVYAKELGVTQQMLYRALVVSNLVTIHLKTGIGSLSAYCGATAAGCGAAAGVTYLYGGQFREIAHTIVNAIAIDSGMICDGAKASCAAKIASAVEAGLLGMQMQMHESQFYGGDGIVVKGVENTIRNIGTLASEGMRETDRTIIRMMIQEH